MQRTIITLLCTAGLAISTSSFAQTLKLRADAPARYTVKQGDTLWGISGRYLSNPWQWPKLWNANRTQLRSPHLIYPGQTLVLSYVNGQPVLGLEDSTKIPVIKIHPGVRTVSDGYGINTINMNLAQTFMQSPQIISTEEMKNAPHLIQGPDSRLIYSPGDRVYSYGLKEPGTYYSYRVNKDITDPDTKKFLGREIIITGKLETINFNPSAWSERDTVADNSRLNDDEYYTLKHPLLKIPTTTAQPMMIREIGSEILKGDYLMREPDFIKTGFQFMPHEPSVPVNAKVLSILDGVSEAAQFQTIAINQGLSQGIDPGTVISIYRKINTTKVERRGNDDGPRYGHISIPSEELALAMVYQANENISYALILSSLTNVSVGDTVREPGRDLDDFSNHSTHVPNEPQEPHYYEHGNYNRGDYIKY
ncbi:LysM domain-containing protein [Vitreoscilla sp. C1]|uniref:LysM peptidoglycan-binding domain-containing protein n=1 Tax=Vitreoscilla sp. (strain C1) TaxID=96942 RepID=UPI00148EAE21|nr:LysM peptidoglycan-binding domain-containing protein [Vitreoscilla sp. C1]QJQ52466.1 LysM domain-containing protein [Vitreoscilla sp. C1]